MKNRNTWIYLAVGLLLLLLVILLWRSNQNRFDWNETYLPDSKAPYGTYVIYKLLQAKAEEYDFSVVKDSINEVVLPGELPASYVFIGEGLFMTPRDVEALLDFVSEGNTAFISSKTIPYDLMFHLYYFECNGYEWDDYSFYLDTLATLSLNHPDLELAATTTVTYQQRNEAQAYNWHYIDDEYFCEEDSLVKIGSFNDSLANFAMLHYGQGRFLLHTTPIAFTNLSLLKSAGFDYANKVFAHLPEGPLYWDDYSRVPEAVGRRRNTGGNNSLAERRLSSSSPLQYILQQPPLSWAWYLLLIMALLYLIFGAKRKQRIIPVLEKNSNTSLEFLATIGRLYFIQNNHRQLSIQKMKLFQAFVRDRYNIHLKEMKDDKVLARLATKSEIPISLLEKIQLLHSNIQSSNFVSENTLIEFHKLIDQFYKHCK